MKCAYTRLPREPWLEAPPLHCFRSGTVLAGGKRYCAFHAKRLAGGEDARKRAEDAPRTCAWVMQNDSTCRRPATGLLCGLHAKRAHVHRDPLAKLPQPPAAVTKAPAECTAKAMAYPCPVFSEAFKAIEQELAKGGHDASMLARIKRIVSHAKKGNR